MSWVQFDEIDKLMSWIQFDGTDIKSTLMSWKHSAIMIRDNEDHEPKSIENYRQHNDCLNEKTQLSHN
jgi:hypothetical protein